jgi:hypothetical protein
MSNGRIYFLYRFVVNLIFGKIPEKFQNFPVLPEALFKNFQKNFFE